MKPARPDAFAIAAFFALLPAVIVGGAMGLPVLICLAGAAALRPSLLRQALETRPLALLLLALLLGWIALSGAWSPAGPPVQAVKIAAIAGLGLMFAAAAGADPDSRRLARAGALAAVIVMAILLAVEAVWGLPLNRAAQPHAEIGDLGRNGSRATSVVVATVWAAASGLLAEGGTARTNAARALLAAAALLSFQFDQLATLVAFAAGLGVYALALAAPRLAPLAISGGLAAWMLAAPFITPLALSNQRLVDALPLSWAARAGIWDYVCARILEQPWVGHGLDASRAVTDRIAVRGDLDMRAVPVHPHSASLQIWFETGLVGALLAAGALIAGGLWLSRALGHDRTTAAAACAALAAIGVIANVSYSLWAEWWLATMALTAAMTAAVYTPPR